MNRNVMFSFNNNRFDSFSFNWNKVFIINSNNLLLSFCGFFKFMKEDWFENSWNKVDWNEMTISQFECRYLFLLLIYLNDIFSLWILFFINFNISFFIDNNSFPFFINNWAVEFIIYFNNSIWKSSFINLNFLVLEYWSVYFRNDMSWNISVVIQSESFD